MQRYFKLSAVLACALLAPFALPAAASAGCPGCEEYTLDIPEKDPEPAPAPAPAPVPTAPTAPAPTTTVPTTTTPVPTAPAPAEEPDPKPADTDPDPVPGKTVKPADLKAIPAIAATQATPTASEVGGDPGNLLPLAIAMAAIAVVAAVLGYRREGGNAASAPPESG